MSDLQPQYLSAMGIQSWDLVHPERLPGYPTSLTSLDAGCRLLLVSDRHPTQPEAQWLERVLQTFHLTIHDARHVLPQHVGQLDLSALEWIWFAGCDVAVDTPAKRLHSPALREIEGNTQHRRDLWQQIRAYGAQQ